MITNRNISTVIRKIKDRMKNLPDPSVTLVGKKWKNPYMVLTSCILSLRTKDETTLPASERLFALAQDPQTMVKVDIKKIEKAIYPVGFYKTKAKQIKELSQVLIDQYEGKVPDSIDELIKLKGVGRKTANLTVTEGFGIPAICVDTHVHRISNRFGYVETKTPDETEWALRDKLPKKYWIEYNAQLVTWGQNICRPISPRCSECPVDNMCPKIGVEVKR